ncbi:MAG: hypothetical protein GDA50_07935 [Alphaproteobacteria bacterium GM202ARS2]|nr:hypothetical protein [Alphaproteobacteria bacterium GM202ARS2]
MDDLEQNDGQGFAAGTPILMADGTLKRIEHIEVGDRVASFNGLGTLRPRMVLGHGAHSGCGLVSFDNLQVTPGQLFMIRCGRFIPLRNVGPSDPLVLQCGALFDIELMSKVAGRHTAYNLWVEGPDCYIASGYRVRGSVADHAGQD